MEMKNTFRHLWVALTLIAATTACSDNEPDSTQTPQTPVVLKALSYTFDSDEGTVWKNGETFGVFMLKEGTTQVVGNYANLCYTADNYSATGYLIPSGDPMYYPSDGTSVNLIAYHPYSTETRASEHQVTFDLSDQSKIAADDFIYSNDGKTLGKNSGSYELQLKPVLSRLNMNLVPGSGFSEEELATAQLMLNNIHTNASFDLLEGKFHSWGEMLSVEMKGDNQGQYKALIFPGEIQTATSLSITFTKEDGTIMQVETPIHHTVEEAVPNTEYEINVKITENGAETTLVGTSYIYILDWQDDKDNLNGNTGETSSSLWNLVSDTRLDSLSTENLNTVTSVPKTKHTWYGMANKVDATFDVFREQNQGNVLYMKCSGELAWYKNYLGYTSERADSACYQLTFKARSTTPGAKLKTYVRINQSSNLFFVLKDADQSKACASADIELNDVFTTYVVNFDFRQTVNTINSKDIVIAPSTQENRNDFYVAFAATEENVEYLIDDITFIKLKE